MAEALDGRLSSEANGPVIAWMRDIAALSATLPGALLLTVRNPADPKAKPLVCHHLEAWGLPCRHLDVDDDLVVLERGLLLRLLVEAGLPGFVWAGLRLVVVHLVVPGNFRSASGHGFGSVGEDLDVLAEGEPRPVKGAWEDARAFWYDLGGGGSIEPSPYALAAEEE
jgi:hypothetical protein